MQLRGLKDMIQANHNSYKSHSGRDWTPTAIKTSSSITWVGHYGWPVRTPSYVFMMIMSPGRQTSWLQMTPDCLLLDTCIACLYPGGHVTGDVYRPQGMHPTGFQTLMLVWNQVWITSQSVWKESSWLLALFLLNIPQGWHHPQVIKRSIYNDLSKWNQSHPSNDQ